MKIAIGCDPNAADLKRELIAVIEEEGHTAVDFGSEDPLYPLVAADVAKAAASGEYDRGVVICGTGIGVSIAANKVPGAYCALATDTYQAKRAQLSNNANVIAMGAQVTGIELAKEIMREYLRVAYEDNERSGPKVDALRALDD